MRMRIFTILLIIAIAMMFIGSALAVGPGETVEYPDGAMGKVVLMAGSMLSGVSSAMTAI